MSGIRAAPSEQDLLAKLRAIDDGTPKLYALVNADGSSSLSTLGDARDAAAGMRAMIEPQAAVGETFNIGPAAAHAHREFVEYLGNRLGLEVVEVRHRKPRATGMSAAPRLCACSATALPVTSSR